MADVAGRDYVLEVSTNGSSYTEVGGLKSASDSFSHNMIDTTDNDSAGWSSSMSGTSTLTASFTLNYDELDSGQDMIRTSNEGKTSLYYRLSPAGRTAGNREIKGQAYITSFEDPSASFDGVEEISMEIQFTGALTIQAQT